jgi:hypothetical protein
VCGAPAKDTFWKDSKRLELVDAEIKAIEGRATHTAMGVDIEEKDREKYKRLRVERKEIKTKIGL